MLKWILKELDGSVWTLFMVRERDGWCAVVNLALKKLYKTGELT
jgi:hypothetical protein